MSPSQTGALMSELSPDIEQVAAPADVSAIAEAVARRSYGKLVAFLAARTRDVGAAEDALSEAFVDRRQTGRANWPDIVKIYDALAVASASPVVAINRALAVAELNGPAAGLAALQNIAEDPRLREYQPYWAARAELLARNGAREEAHSAYDVAIGLERDPAVRRFLQKRKASLAS